MRRSLLARILDVTMPANERARLRGSHVAMLAIGVGLGYPLPGIVNHLTGNSTDVAVLVFNQRERDMRQATVVAGGRSCLLGSIAAGKSAACNLHPLREGTVTVTFVDDGAVPKEVSRDLNAYVAPGLPGAFGLVWLSDGGVSEVALAQ